MAEILNVMLVILRSSLLLFWEAEQTIHSADICFTYHRMSFFPACDPPVGFAIVVFLCYPTYEVKRLQGRVYPSLEHVSKTVQHIFHLIFYTRQPSTEVVHFVICKLQLFVCIFFMAIHLMVVEFQR